MLISTRHLAALPDIETLKRLCRSLAMLDALLQPEWEGRYYSFNAGWSAGQSLASMRNGSGDDYFIVFDEQAGAVIKGYAHESEMARYSVDTGTCWPGTLDQMPAAFRSILTDPAFRLEDTTFCIWRGLSDAEWTVGDIRFPAGADPDGSQELLALLDGRPAAYKRWAEEYYETDVPLKLVRHIYAHRPLNAALLSDYALNVSLADVLADVKEIGYPHKLSDKNPEKSARFCR